MTVSEAYASFARSTCHLKIVRRRFSEVSAMWRYILLFLILIASPEIGWCDTIQFTVPQADIGILYKACPSFCPPDGSEVDLFSSGLNGTVLAGQHLSFDLLLSDNVLARVFNQNGVAILFSIFTNDGNQFGDSVGALTGGHGVFIMSLPPLAGARVIDISGVHFDITFPATGFVVTDARLRFDLINPPASVEFGTAQQLPEPSTLGLTLVGVLVIALAAWRRDLKSLSSF